MPDQGYEQTPNHLPLVLYRGPRTTPLYLHPELPFLNRGRRQLPLAPFDLKPSTSPPSSLPPPFISKAWQDLPRRHRPWPQLTFLKDVPDRARPRPGPLLDRLVRDFMEDYQPQQLLSAALPTRAAIKATTCQACSGEVDTSSGIFMDSGHGYHKDCLAWSYMLAMIKILEKKYKTSQRDHD